MVNDENEFATMTRNDSDACILARSQH